MKRAIQRMIQDPLAMKILDGEVLHGDHVMVDSKDGKLTFELTTGRPKQLRSRRRRRNSPKRAPTSAQSADVGLARVPMK